jgi:hypothetical protein
MKAAIEQNIDELLDRLVKATKAATRQREVPVPGRRTPR